MTAFQGPPSPSRRALREEQRRARPLAEEIDDSQIASEARPSGRRARAIVTDGVVSFVADPEPTDAADEAPAAADIAEQLADQSDPSIWAHATGAVPTSSIPFIMTTQTPRDSNSVVTPAETYVSPYSRRASTPEQTVDAPAAEDTLMDQNPTADVTEDADASSKRTSPEAVAIPVGEPAVVAETTPVDPLIVPREERTMTRRELRAMRAAAEAAAAAEAGAAAVDPNATEEELAAAEQAAADARKAAKLEARRAAEQAATSGTPVEQAAPDAATPDAHVVETAAEPVAPEVAPEPAAPVKPAKSGLGSIFGRGKAAPAPQIDEAPVEPAKESVEPATEGVESAVEATAVENDPENEVGAESEDSAPSPAGRASTVIPPLVEPTLTPAAPLSGAMAEFEALTRGSRPADSGAPAAFPMQLEPEAIESTTPQNDDDAFTSAPIVPAVIDQAPAATPDIEPVDLQPVDLQPADIEPAVIYDLDATSAEVDDSSQPATYVPPIGHWSRQADDEDENQPPENTISREVGGGNNSMSTNALVLPQIPQRDDFSSVLSATGEILITGTINLPGSVGATGRDSRHYDDPEVDRLFDSYDQELPVTDSAPVRAISAVSSHTATRGGIESSGKNSNRMLTVLLVSASGMAAVVLGLLVTGFVLNIF